MPKIAEIIEAMDPGLKRGLLQVFRHCEGKESAVSKEQLMDLLAQYGRHVSKSTFERQIRRGITELRQEGHLICSSSGDAGYFLAANRAEYDDFIEREIKNRIRDLQETERAMDEAAMQRWGTGAQMGLF